MKLTGLHCLLTYRCTYECDHCFVWGSPRKERAMSLELVRLALDQADELDSMEWVYFEGGEPFLYHPVLLAGVRAAAERHYSVGIVTNAYWATAQADALEWLRPLQGLVQELSISTDQYHGEDWVNEKPRIARQAAESLGIPAGFLSIAGPGSCADGAESEGGGNGGAQVAYRGRAAAVLAEKAPREPWESFTECPHEEIRAPERAHLDPLGNLHLCQGVLLGNIRNTPLRRICEEYRPENDPVLGPLLAGGPAELVRAHGLAHEDGYADACHLCYESRLTLRAKLPEILAPDEVYGDPED